MSRDPDEQPAQPGDAYAQRLAAAQAEAEHFAARERLISNARLLVFGAALLLGWFVFGTRQIAALWLVPPVALFIVLLVLHDRAITRKERADRSVAFFEDGIARLEDRWAGRGNSGEGYREEGHPYADDLDLFGEGSLFELLCTAPTPAGQRNLAQWLKVQGEADEVRARQRAVEELRGRLALRLDLSLIGQSVGAQLNPAALIAWGAAPPQTFSPGIRIAAVGFSAASLAAAAAWVFSEVGMIPFLFAIAAQSVFAASIRRRVAPVIAAVTAPTRGLALLRGLLERIEAEPFEAPRLRELRALLEREGHPPSHNIARLQRLSDLLDARGNQFFAPIGALLLWGTHLAFAVERWRADCGRDLGPWIEAAGEIEALLCLGGYAYEHPEQPFPTIEDEGPVFDGRALGHPLLPRDGCVTNDIRIDSEPQAYIMSGSNMSGKSTMLRTVGCNTVLALAGAPVRAEALRVSPLVVAASIRISDSLQTGTSHFYAEIKRLRQVVDLTNGPRPVLFLLDEILHGTNSHDRRIGAAAVIRSLIERGAVGIVTTHDLALARIADELAPRMQNVHFADHMADGAMAFDYRLREGVVTKSNAIALMRSVGLEV